MTATDELVRQPLEVARRAVRELVPTVSGASLDDVNDAESVLVADDSSAELERGQPSERWTRLAAMELLHAARQRCRPYPLGGLETSGWEAIDAGDFTAAEGIGQQLLELANDDADWNYGSDP